MRRRAPVERGAKSLKREVLTGDVEGDEGIGGAMKLVRMSGWPATMVSQGAQSTSSTNADTHGLAYVSIAIETRKK
jgi:hypothetical protein